MVEFLQVKRKAVECFVLFLFFLMGLFKIKVRKDVNNQKIMKGQEIFKIMIENCGEFIWG